MEIELIHIFLISLFGTLLIVRLWAHYGHDRLNYKTNFEKSKTLTGYLRKKTGFDWHHIHIGIIFVIVSCILIYFNKITNSNIILAGMGISMIMDQIFPLFKFGDYFSRKMLNYSIILHLLIALFAITLS